MLAKNLLFILFFLVLKPIFAQNLDILKEKIKNNEIFWADPFSEPFDSVGNWTGKGVKDSLVLLEIKKNRDFLEDFVIELFQKSVEQSQHYDCFPNPESPKIENGKPKTPEEKMGLAHLAAYLGYEKAIEPIWKILINTSQMHGWEGPNYDMIDTYLEEVQYVSQAYYWACLKGLLRKNPAQSLKKEHYQVLEKSMAVFLEKYAHETFLPNDSNFEMAAWHYVLMKKIDSTNVFVRKIEEKMAKRQVWALVLNSELSFEKAEAEMDRWKRQVHTLTDLFFYKNRIDGEIRYQVLIFGGSGAEIYRLREELKLIRPEIFIMTLPCYPPRRSYEDWQIYQCGEW